MCARFLARSRASWPASFGSELLRTATSFVRGEKSFQRLLSSVRWSAGQVCRRQPRETGEYTEYFIASNGRFDRPGGPFRMHMGVIHEMHRRFSTSDESIQSSLVATPRRIHLSDVSSMRIARSDGVHRNRDYVNSIRQTTLMPFCSLDRRPDCYFQ